MRRDAKATTQRSLSFCIKNMQKRILAQRESLELVRSYDNIWDLLALKCVMDVSMTNSPFFAGKLVAPTFVIQ